MSRHIDVAYGFLLTFSLKKTRNCLTNNIIIIFFNINVSELNLISWI